MMVGIALGSNLGDRARALNEATAALRTLVPPGGKFVTAPWYRSDPVECEPGSGEFLNTALEMEWVGGDALDLLRRCQAIEASLGRPSGAERGKNRPRTIDIDLLYTDQGSFRHRDLELPHPRLADRSFVLVPLAVVVPGRVPGGMSLTLSEMCRALPHVSGLRPWEQVSGRGGDRGGLDG